MIEMMKHSTLKALVSDFHRSEEILFYDSGNEISFNQFRQDVMALGTQLFIMGFFNCMIAVIGENSYNWILSYFATVCGGNVIVPLDKELMAEDLNQQLVESECKVLIYSGNYKKIVETIGCMANSITSYICMDNLKELIMKGTEKIEDGYRQYTDYDVKEEQMATIVYTSGTTGRNKGVMLTHLNVCSDVYWTGKYVYFPERTVVVLPLHHTFGLIACLLIPMWQKSTIYINSNLRNIMLDFRIARPKTVCLVPLFVESFYKSIWINIEKQGQTAHVKDLIKASNDMLSHGIDERKKIFKSVLQVFGGELDTIISGGAILDPKYVNGFRDLGIEVLNGYGITECSPVISANCVSSNKDGSVGKTIGCCRVKVHEPDKNGIGEIYVTGLNIMRGYFKNEVATRKSFDGKWFCTGDLGYIDEEGYVFITGRTKNLIILSNGKNVSPEELEEKIHKIKYVKEVIVTYEMDYIFANVFLDEENYPDAKDKIRGDIEQLNLEIPSYKRISKINIRENEFEKTSTKKIKRGIKQ